MFPSLSHAERRRQKKEAKLAAQLQADADAEDAPVKKRKLKDGSAKTVRLVKAPELGVGWEHVVQDAAGGPAAVLQRR